MPSFLIDPQRRTSPSRPGDVVVIELGDSFLDKCEARHPALAHHANDVASGSFHWQCLFKGRIKVYSDRWR
jgi:hypothetical protein